MISIEEVVAQPSSGPHAVPSHGDLRETQDASDLPRAHSLQIPEDKNDALTPGKPVEAFQQLGSQVGLLEASLE
jgi:hypothetical protein